MTQTLIKNLPHRIILKPYPKKAIVNCISIHYLVIKYGVVGLEQGIIKILKFIQTQFGEETLFSLDEVEV